MRNDVPDFPLPMGGLLPLLSQAQQRGSNDFSPLWSGEAAPLARELPGQRLTAELAKGALERLRGLGASMNAVPQMDTASPVGA